jgi:hypothetical protein
MLNRMKWWWAPILILAGSFLGGAARELRREHAIAAGTQSAETRSKAPSEGCQSGPEGIAQKDAPNA